MKSFLKKFVRRENFVATLLIVTAILSFFDIPQRIGITELKVILIMIGFLALDALIEKIGYLENIENSTSRIENIIAPHPNSVILRSRRDLLPFPDRIQGVKNVFVLAISANNLISQNFRTIESALKSGVNFKFLLVSPNNPAIKSLSLSSPSAASEETQIRWIMGSKEMLEKIAQSQTRGKLELRWFQGVPTTSIVTYDVESSNGLVQIEPHTFRQTPADRPVFNIQIQSRNEWYDYYKEVVGELWENGIEVMLPNQNIPVKQNA